MSDTDLELLLTLDDPPYGPDEDRFDHHQSEDGVVSAPRTFSVLIRPDPTG